MNLIPWRNKSQSNVEGTALGPIERLRGEMDSLVERFFQEPFGGLALRNMPSLFERDLKLEMEDTPDEIVVRAELPGVEPKDVNVEVVQDMLTIKAEKRRHEEKKTATCLCSEVQYGGLSRTVRLPAGADASKVKAKHKNGVLTITIGKDPSQAPKRIPVQGE